MVALNSDNNSFLAELAKGCVVFDGAIGTLLYDRGVYFNRCFEELCLLQPELIRQVHKDYIDVGASVIQTNTYGANKVCLARFNLADQVDAICHAAVDIAKKASGGRAFIVGSIGPTRLLPKDIFKKSVRKTIFDAFRQTALALTEAGCDGLIFETFSYVGELEIALEAAYGLKIPLIAQATFDDGMLTADGAGVLEVSERLVALGADAIGANCLLGPERIQDIAELLVKSNKPVVIQPNVGYPRNVDGRSVYASSPETFGVCARRAFKLGVAGYGGCCGTTPEYIRRVAAAARMCGESTSLKSKFPTAPVENSLKKKSRDHLSDCSALARQLLNNEFPISVEVSPPPSIHLDKIMEQLKTLQKENIQFINVPDGPRATVRMSNIAFCKLVMEQTQLEPILHVCGRDHNLLGLISLLLGSHALGIRNTVIITGDPPKLGDYPNATAVFDIDSIGILHLAHQLNSGFDPTNKAIDFNTEFLLLTGVEPHAVNQEREMERLYQKIDAGAQVIMTQPVYDPECFHRFLDTVEPLGIPIMMGVLPLASEKNALFLHNNMPGMQIPAAILQRMQVAGNGADGQQEGIKIAQETIKALRNRIQGLYIMPPLGRLHVAIELIRGLKLGEYGGVFPDRLKSPINAQNNIHD